MTETEAPAPVVASRSPVRPQQFLPDPLRPLPGFPLGVFAERAEGPDHSREPAGVYGEEEQRHLVERGRQLFFSTTAFGQRPSEGPQVRGEVLSCSSCHSGPGFADGRTHVVGPTRDREVVLRQTPHLFGLARSAPYGWDARNPTIENQTRGAAVSPLEMNSAREPTRAELDALVAFMLTIDAPPAVPGVDFDKALAGRGKEIFEDERGIDPSGEFSPNVEISCATCHLGPLFTDNKPHRIAAPGVPFGDPVLDPGTQDENGTVQGFDTPPLVGLRLTAPYFHDGLAGDPTEHGRLYGTELARRSLRENLIPFYNLRFAFNYTPAEMDALTEFLLSL